MGLSAAQLRAALGPDKRWKHFSDEMVSEMRVPRFRPTGGFRPATRAGTHIDFRVLGGGISTVGIAKQPLRLPQGAMVKPVAREPRAIADNERERNAERSRRIAELRERGRRERERSAEIAAEVSEPLERARAHERALRAIRL